METIEPSYAEGEQGSENEDPWPGEDGENTDEGDEENSPDDIPTDDNEIDEEMVALGREGVEKIAADLNSGNVHIYQYLNGALAGLGVGANANGIIASAANFIEDMTSDRLLHVFGKSISTVGIVCGACQTIVAIKEGEEFSTNDWLNVVSTALGAAALIPLSFPITGCLGITSGIIGIISTFISELEPGLYIFEDQDGSSLYLFVRNGFVS